MIKRQKQVSEITKNTEILANDTDNLIRTPHRKEGGGGSQVVLVFEVTQACLDACCLAANWSTSLRILDTLED